MNFRNFADDTKLGKIVDVLRESDRCSEELSQVGQMSWQKSQEVQEKQM